MNYSVVDTKYRDFILQIQSHFAKHKSLIWDRRNKIKVLEFETEDLVVKSFKIPHFINRVVYSFFRDSKAKKSYENSLKIATFVPKAIGYAVFRKHGLIYDSYFISEAYPYDFTIREPLTQETFDDKEAIFTAFAAFTLSLHEEGIEHLDYSPGNILIKKREEGYEFKLIDINRMKFRTLSLENRVKNFSKLWATDEDLTVILKAYAKHAKIDEEQVLEIGLKASQAHKAKKNLKKRLKGKKVVD